MKTVIIPRGIPGSGKTTWTLEQLKLHKRGTAVRINNDDLSAMMFSSHWGDFFNDDATRQMLHELRLNMLRTFLAQDHIEYIYVDNTNLAMKTVKALFDVASQADAEVVVYDEFLHIPVEVCIERDALRPRPVGEKVIRDMHKQASKIKPWNAPEIPAIMDYSNDYPGAEEIIICDIDGTLALMNGRGPYEFHKVDTDVPNYPVKNLIDTLRSEGVMRTVFLSGRGEECRAETTKWLQDNLVEWDIELYMRPAGDTRPDWIVKYELFQEHIAGKYNVAFVLDDRDQVINLWRRKLMLPTFQVADGNF